MLSPWNPPLHEAELREFFDALKPLLDEENN